MAMDTNNYQCAVEIADPIRDVRDWLEQLVKELRKIRTLMDANGIMQHGDVQWAGVKSMASAVELIEDEPELLAKEGGDTNV